MQSLEKIEGISESYASILKEAGVRSVEHLLRAGNDGSLRRSVSRKTGISESRLQAWAQSVNLLPIKGVSDQLRRMLEILNVDSLAILAKQDSMDLLLKLSELNERLGFTPVMPSHFQVKNWIDQAQTILNVYPMLEKEAS